MALLIRPEDNVKSFEIIQGENNGKLSLVQMQKAVEGYVEKLDSNCPGYLLLVNEDGTRLRQSVNIVATRLLAGKYGTQLLRGPVLFAQRNEMG